MNNTPPAVIIRLKDVLAWIPSLTRAELKKWEAAGLIHPVRYRRKGFPRRKGKLGRRWYRTCEIVKILDGANGIWEVKGATRKK